SGTFDISLIRTAVRSTTWAASFSALFVFALELISGGPHTLTADAAIGWYEFIPGVVAHNMRRSSALDVDFGRAWRSIIRNGCGVGKRREVQTVCTRLDAKAVRMQARASGYESMIDVYSQCCLHGRIIAISLVKH
ncbi:hypothetical protein C8R44DRAFT_781019, partial [Mycena epipterygia]